MKLISNAFMCAVLITTIHVPARAQQRTTGRVTDSVGAVIENARVLIHWDSTNGGGQVKTNVGIKADLTVTTNKEGLFEAELPEGFYDLFITSNAFTPNAIKSRVRSGINKPIAIKLKVDPLILKEID